MVIDAGVLGRLVAAAFSVAVAVVALALAVAVDGIGEGGAGVGQAGELAGFQDIEGVDALASLVDGVGVERAVGVEAQLAEDGGAGRDVDVGMNSTSAPFGLVIKIVSTMSLVPST